MNSWVGCHFLQDFRCVVIFVSYQLFTRNIYWGNFVRQLSTKYVLKSCLMLIYWVLYGGCGHSYFYNCFLHCLFVWQYFFSLQWKRELVHFAFAMYWRFLYVIVFKDILWASILSDTSKKLICKIFPWV